MLFLRFLKSLFTSQIYNNLTSYEQSDNMFANEWYFEPIAGEIASLVMLIVFEQLLMSKLVHVLRLGLHLRSLHDGEEATAVDTSAPSGKIAQKFVKKALSTWMDKDKFFPLRRSAPSLSLISNYLPLDDGVSAMTVFSICTLRAFGVGSQDAINELIKALHIPGSSTDIHQALISDRPDFKRIETTIQAQGKGTAKISRPVYGQLQIARASISTMLEKFWVFAEKVIKEDGSACTFEEVYTLICNTDIPTVPKYGLLAWLIASDLTEWKICEEPTIETLAEHMGVASDQRSSTKRGSPSGPNKALKTVE